LAISGGIGEISGGLLERWKRGMKLELFIAIWRSMGLLKFLDFWLCD